MFLGQVQRSLDTKGRIVLPAKYRDRLEDGCVVTKGQERCLYVFPRAVWEEEMTQVARLPRTNRNARAYTRIFTSFATDQEPDRQGRIQLPPELRQYADLEKEVTVVGVVERLEIWNTDHWRRFADEADRGYSEIEESLSEYGV